jgi:hypothetical protein
MGIVSLSGLKDLLIPCIDINIDLERKETNRIALAVDANICY